MIVMRRTLTAAPGQLYITIRSTDTTVQLGQQPKVIAQVIIYPQKDFKIPSCRDKEMPPYPWVAAVISKAVGIDCDLSEILIIRYCKSMSLNSDHQISWILQAFVNCPLQRMRDISLQDSILIWPTLITILWCAVRQCWRYRGNQSLFWVPHYRRNNRCAQNLHLNPQKINKFWLDKACHLEPRLGSGRAICQFFCWFYARASNLQHESVNIIHYVISTVAVSQSAFSPDFKFLCLALELCIGAHHFRREVIEMPLCLQMRMSSWQSFPSNKRLSWSTTWRICVRAVNLKSEIVYYQKLIPGENQNAERTYSTDGLGTTHRQCSISGYNLVNGVKTYIHADSNVIAVTVVPQQG